MLLPFPSLVGSTPTEFDESECSGKPIVSAFACQRVPFFPEKIKENA
jgi:hypothetical protein